MTADWLTDTRLIMALWAAVGVIALGYGFRRRKRPASIDRQISIVSAAVGAVLLMLGVQAARYAVFQQRAIAGRVGIDPEFEEVVSNPRQTSNDLSRPRGSILAADGSRIAWSQQTGNVYTRFYGDTALAAAVGYYSPLLYGKSGIEATWDDALSGRGGRSLLDQIAGGLGLSERGPLDLTLTIQPELQRNAVQLLDGHIGAAIVLDPKTGAVWAMASSPAVDPVPLAAVDQHQVEVAQRAWQTLLDDPSRPLVRRATEGLYPPGSTFKVVTASAALQSGVVEPDTVFEDNGSIEIEGHFIEEANRPDDSITTWTLMEGFAYSLNVVFAQVGLRVGRATLEQRAEAFGIGSSIPFDVPVSAGQIASSGDFLDSKAALADTAFGQGELLVTPMHMAMVASAVANEGSSMRPYLVQSLADAAGKVVSTAEPKIWRAAVDQQTADTMQAFMVDAVEWGYAGGALLPGYRVGGKTGTAESGSEIPHGWFIGFAGEDDPRAVVAVLLEHGGEGGGYPTEIGAQLLMAALLNNPV
ncbi:MAG TPA: penicillin-binding protein 2 [Thermomicrobiales bacterium]|nr:penicillin-binding protein 2 [Thermomicrobiales bacterium]